MSQELPPMPASIFNENLQATPQNVESWNQYVNELKEILKHVQSENNPSTENVQTLLKLNENLGLAQRILSNLTESEDYLTQALAMSFGSPKSYVQNLIRLAHTYQSQGEFIKSKALFDQTKQLIYQQDQSFQKYFLPFYYQHIGKLYFDQSFFKIALIYFQTALSLRIQDQVPQDQIDSSLLALNTCHSKLTNSSQKKITSEDFKQSEIQILIAQLNDSHAIHDAHMRSIQNVCAPFYTKAEIEAWGGRPYNKTGRENSIKNDFYLMVKKQNLVEGFAYAKVFFDKDKNQLNLKTNKMLHLFGLYLCSPVLNQKIGRSLIETLIEYAHYEEVNRITLRATLNALEFYKKMGFVQNGDVVSTTINGVDVRGVPMLMRL